MTPTTSRTLDDITAVVSRAASATFGTPELPCDDDFVDRGATSLSLLTLHARLRSDLDADFPFRVVYDNRTVRSLSSALSSVLRP